MKRVTKRYQQVQERLGDVMGGKVLEYEAKTILRQGIQQGLQEGQLTAYRELIRDGLISLSEAAKRMKMSEEELRNYL